MSRFSFNSAILLFALTLVTACGGKNQKETVFHQLIPVEEMNTKIRFWKPGTHGTIEVYKINESVDMTLENFSQDKIIFPPDYGVRIFTFDKGKGIWDEIENGAKYFPPGNIQFSPKTPDIPGVRGVGLLPMLKNKGKPIDIRVVIVGNVERNGVLTDEQIGAYIDLTLQP